MRRADRLFQILQLLRPGRTVTAAELASELEVSGRTIYRDVKDLVASGVPIEGEAGVGYLLGDGFDLPPLMFTGDEIDALALGVRLLEAHGDAGLARSARAVLAKARAALPEELRDRLDRVPMHAPSFHLDRDASTHLEALRRAIAEARCVELTYLDAAGTRTSRLVHPKGLFCWGHTWSFAAWCTLRTAFRNFRTDRVESLEVTDAAFDPDEHDLDAFLARVRSEKI